ncbi:MAG TPA: glycosyltransferase family 4 protein [Blastocatellia bacterium]|nr:glycosyltransferase family 4 protein [Blastocatellia bacterium]
MSRDDLRRPLRVVHLSPTLFGEEFITGGGERFVTELARAMSRLVPTRLVSFSESAGERSRLHDCPGSGPATGWRATAGLDVQLFKPLAFVRGQKTNPLSFRFLRALADADVIHCHQFHVLATTLALAYGRLRGKRLFVTDLGGGGWDLSYHFDLGRWVDGFLHISEFSAQQADARYRRKSHVIYAGVAVEKFRPTGHPKRPVVLFVGRLLPHKGINYLIEAMDPQTELRIIGRPWEPHLAATRSEEYLALLRRLATGKNVRFIFDADDDQLVEEYSTALVTVLPSVYTDVFGQTRPAPELLGLTLLESLACGTPVIATRVGGMPEVVEEGVTGFLVPPNNVRALAERIAWIKNHPGEAQRMGERGRRHVEEKFTWDQVARRALEIYQHALAATGSR